MANEQNDRAREKLFDSSAVDELVAAQSGKAKAYSEKELKKYRTRKGISLAEWLKIILLKAWFAGVVCYFILWGLGTYLSATLDLLFVTGVALGLVNDLLLNNLLRFMEEKDGQNSRWMMVPLKGFVSLPLNLLYSCGVLACVYKFYTAFNAFAAGISGNPQEVALGVEPIMFGLLYMGFDMLFITIRLTLLKIFRDAMRKSATTQKK